MSDRGRDALLRLTMISMSLAKIASIVETSGDRTTAEVILDHVKLLVPVIEDLLEELGVPE